MKIIIALGGNALIKRNEKETYENLLKNIKASCESIVNLIKNNKVVITHGNGPEVGNLLLQNEIAKKTVPRMPLDILNAETEGFIGYLIQEQLLNEFRKNKIKKHIATLITQTLVSKKDKAFQNPTKFIGRFYTEKEANLLKNKFIIKKDSNRGFRRVVPSPKPIKIIESKILNYTSYPYFLIISSTVSSSTCSKSL
jgi:carbamate kinase